MPQSKAGFMAILAMAALALLGIIGLQAYWLHQSLSAKEAQFETQVTEALSSFSKNLEKSEGAGMLLNHIELLSDPQYALRSVGGSNLYERPDSVSLRSLHPDLEGAKRPADHFDSQIPDGLEVVSNFSDKGRNYQSTGRVVVRTAVSPEGIRISRKVYQLDSIFQEIVRSGYTGEEPLNRRISLYEIDTLLRDELALRGIDMPFAFGVFEETILNDSLCSPDFEPQKVQYKTPLFQSDIKHKPRHLGIHFNARSAYLLSSIWSLVLMGSVFTLIMIFTFGATLRVALKQKRLSEMKTDFINNMSHEFKTPIATIGLALDAINNPRVQGDPERVKHYSDIIRFENKRMNRQVEDILRLAMLDRRELKIEMQAMQMHELIQDVCLRLKLNLNARNAKLDLKLMAENDLVDGDYRQLSVVLENLIDNALKYSPGSPEIIIKTANQNNQILVHVSDKGMGMRPEVQRLVFDKFYRAESGNVHNIKGHGLGLAFVKAVCLLHGGEISVKSSLGQGSTFTINLPLYGAKQ